MLADSGVLSFWRRQWHSGLWRSAAGAGAVDRGEIAHKATRDLLVLDAQHAASPDHGGRAVELYDR